MRLANLQLMTTRFRVRAGYMHVHGHGCGMHGFVSMHAVAWHDMAMWCSTLAVVQLRIPHAQQRRPALHGMFHTHDLCPMHIACNKVCVCPAVQRALSQGALACSLAPEGSSSVNGAGSLRWSCRPEGMSGQMFREQLALCVDGEG